jgi:hypothetical protein
MVGSLLATGEAAREYLSEVVFQALDMPNYRSRLALPRIKSGVAWPG